jgi:hypothetical protein
MVKDDVTAHWSRAVTNNLAMVYEGVVIWESGDTLISGLTLSEFQANKRI